MKLSYVITGKGKHKPRLLKELEDAVKEVKLIKAGKKKPKTIKQLLD